MKIDQLTAADFRGALSVLDNAWRGYPNAKKIVQEALRCCALEGVPFTRAPSIDDGKLEMGESLSVESAIDLTFSILGIAEEALEKAKMMLPGSDAWSDHTERHSNELLECVLSVEEALKTAEELRNMFELRVLRSKCKRS